MSSFLSFLKPIVRHLSKIKDYDREIDGILKLIRLRHRALSINFLIKYMNISIIYKYNLVIPYSITTIQT